MREELKQRLLQHLNFIETELGDYPHFRQLTQAQYREDRDQRRNVERWVENIINSSIDIAKVILTLEDIRLPDNYKEIVLSLSTIKALGIDSTESLSRFVRLRNIITHEYIDLKWSSIARFISEAEPLYKDFLAKVKKYLERKIV